MKKKISNEEKLIKTMICTYINIGMLITLISLVSLLLIDLRLIYESVVNITNSRFAKYNQFNPVIIAVIVIIVNLIEKHLITINKKYTDKMYGYPLLQIICVVLAIILSLISFLF